jgi:hypothetical protein
MKPYPMSAPQAGRGLRPVAQPVGAPLTRAAIFLVANRKPGFNNRATLRSFCGDLAALLRVAEFRGQLAAKPAPPMEPTFCFSFGNRSLMPSVTFQAGV